jgi:hypothetical protein
MGENFETNTISELLDVEEKSEEIKSLVGDHFILDSGSDLEHDIYTGKCLGCGKEFSVHVAKGFKGSEKKNLDQITKDVLESKRCQLCREK